MAMAICLDGMGLGKRNTALAKHMEKAPILKNIGNVIVQTQNGYLMISHCISNISLDSYMIYDISIQKSAVR